MNNTDIFPNNSGAFTIEGSKEINNNENQDNSQPLLLNLGCGDDIKKGFINIDLNGDDDRIVIMNVMNLDFPDNSVAVIYAADILPCFSYREIDDVLAEWNRVLIPGGKIIISCTSVKQICKLYMSGKINAEVMSRLIYGTQDNPLNFYLCGFDSDYLGSALKDAGFEIENIEESDDADNIDDINLSIVIIAKKADSNIDINNNIINNNNNFPESTLKFNFSEYDEDENQSVFRFEDENDSLKVFEDKKFIEPEEDIFSPNRIKDEINYLVDKNKPEKLKLNIVWEGSQFVYHSLALINREICYNLIKSDVADLTIIPYEKEQFLPDGNKKYETLKAHDIRFKPVTEPKTAPNPYIWIRHTWPPKSDEPKGAKWIIMQPWEFSTLRADFAETFKQADEIWTPSVFSRTSMTNSGIDFDKVQVIPNGIDPELWSPNGKRMNLKTVKKLKLLFVGGTIYRKGIDILLQAYIQSFSVKDNITLIIKDMGGDSFYRGQTAKNQIDSIKMNPNAPEIIYLDDYLTEEQMVELYKSCDVFVCPYRGEGFSIPTLEAMACGLPVVVTKGGSTDDFVDEEIGWLIPSIKKSVGKVLDNIPLTGEAFLLEPDLEKFIDILKGLYQEPSSIVSKGIVASKRARIEWTWKKSTIKALSRLDLMYETNMALEADTALENYSDDSIKLGIAEDAVKNSEFLKANDLFGDLINSTTLNDRYIQHAICRKVEMCLNLNDLISVDEYLNMAVRRFGYTTDIKYLKAYLLYLNGNTSDSLLILSELHNYWNTYKFETTIGLNQEELLVFTADNLFTDGDSKGALQLYLQAQKINPDNANSWYGAGMCYFSIQSNSEAKRMFLQTLKLNPDFEDARKMLEELGV